MTTRDLAASKKATAILAAWIGAGSVIAGLAIGAGNASAAAANDLRDAPRHHHLHTESSTNWAGPVLAASTYDAVSTTFVVPQAACSAKDRFTIASLWAGLDGGAGTSSTVEQAGVDLDCYKGTAFYQAWTEQYPQPSVPIDNAQFAVNPGDGIRVTVAAQPGSDTYLLDNLTTGQRFSTTVEAPAGAEGASAECIAEAPTGPHGLEKLTNFGTATFSACTAEDVGTDSPRLCQLASGAGCASGSQVTLDNIDGRWLHFFSVRKATTASASGGGFTVTWHHA